MGKQFLREIDRGVFRALRRINRMRQTITTGSRIIKSVGRYTLLVNRREIGTTHQR
ncbi:Uncharacterised protein [Vibrio cholerae]|uniref:Uncharacterized protein n=1 Tax=Vibrio cholerae TaxID=666 RepID=A0A655PZ95_VIBCL|nr:Uncharacterised protein [Vibrio cholerae]CSA24339.1 Uncharacterised protein [Vibrio cholerae]CSA39449.1 Uncharacterised protein [Vibrio cholerae]CSA93725.1 Uncharacterised protein [Vibrio cholerae]CSB37744.1 Uncharacterised protein [Vibrio cholerae]